MCEPKPRPKYKFNTVTYDNPLRVRIVKGDRSAAMRALRAAYAWGKRNNARFFGQTKVYGSGVWMFIYRVSDQTKTE